MAKSKKKEWGGITETHTVLDGKAHVYRVKMSGDVWQFRMYIKQENKHYRKSLQTRDLDSALSKGLNLAAELHAKQNLGQRIFGITLKDAIDQYLEHRQRDVVAGNITQGRWSTIRSHINRLLDLKGKGIRTNELHPNSLFDYLLMRQEKGSVTKVTVRNEQATLNHFAKWAYQNGMLHFQAFEFDTIRISPNEKGVRDTFTIDEYERLFTFMRSYTAKSRVSDSAERIERQIMREYVLISANTLMRVGELRQLRWGDVLRVEKQTKDDTGRPVTPVHIKVRWETSKVREEREIITRGGNYFERLRKHYAKAGVKLEPSDLVFRQVNKNEKFGHRIWAKHWYALMEGAKILDHKERKVTWYSLRHFGISMRVNSGNNILDVAKMAGTSVSHVEKTYLKYDQKRMRKAILKGYVTEDGGFEDLE